MQRLSRIPVAEESGKKSQAVFYCSGFLSVKNIAMENFDPQECWADPFQAWGCSLE